MPIPFSSRGHSWCIFFVNNMMENNDVRKICHSVAMVTNEMLGYV